MCSATEVRRPLTECQHQELDHGECYAGRLVGVICLGKLHRLQMWSNFLSRTTAQKVSLRIFKPPYLLVKLSGQTLLVTLHGACLFAAIYHLNYPRPELNYLPCSSVGIAMVNCSGGRGFESHRGQRVFSFSVWAHFLFGAIRSEGIIGDIYTALQFATFKPLYIQISLFGTLDPRVWNKIDGESL